MEEQHAQSTGNLHKRLFALTSIDESLKDKIGLAKRKRDFLAHHFFRERAVEFASRSGRNKMIAELWADTEYFQALDREVDAEVAKARTALGIREELLAEYVKRTIDNIDRS